MTDIIKEFILNFFSSIGYFEVFFLMTIESSFIPFPSEIVIPPAAFLAAQGVLKLPLVVFFGIIGSLLGASINYFLAVFLGRPIIYKLSETRILKVLLINRKNIEKAENYFITHGKGATFWGRLVPVIRQLISIPAGFSRMNYLQFLFFTFLGSSFWVSTLALLGYFVGQNSVLLASLFSKLFWVSIFSAIVFTLYFISRSIKRTPSK